MNCPLKKQTLFLRKYILKKVKKDHEEELLSLKKKKIKKSKPSSKTSNLYKVDYKIQDTDGFHKIPP